MLVGCEAVTLVWTELNADRLTQKSISSWSTVSFWIKFTMTVSYLWLEIRKYFYASMCDITLFNGFY